MRSRLYTVVFALFLFAARDLRAQFNSSIEGVVSDSSGAVIPGADVTVADLGTGIARHVKTSGEGLYRVLNLGLGKYSVTVEHAGFQTSEHKNVPVAAAEIVRVDVVMQLGAVGEKVTVEAQVPQVETEQGRVSGRIDTQQLKELPLNGSNLYNLLAIQPGVSGRGLAASFGAGGGGSNNDSFAAENQPEINASGQRVESNGYALDDSSVNSAARGGVANITPNPDSIAEVRVVSNNFSAVNGRSSGGQVEMVSKSGTNEFHGGFTELFQNNTLADRNEFEASTPVFRRNEFGYYVGGPVIRNRTFFFTSFNGLRQSGARGQVYTVETAQFRNYVASAYPNSIAAKLFTQFAPASDPTYNFKVLPPISGGIAPPAGIPEIGSLRFAPSAFRNGQQFSGRIDHQLRPGKDTLYVNFYRTWAQTLNGGIRPAFNRSGNEYGTFVSLNETHIFTPNLLNEFRANMMRVVGTSIFPPNIQVPSISVTSISGFSTNGYPSGYFQTNLNYKNVVSWVRGAHTIKTGGEVRRVRANSINTSNFIPSYSFTSALTFAADNPYQQTRLVDPRTGLPAVNEVGLRNWEWAGFVNDDWKVTRNLTFNLGIRYENFESPTEVNGLLRDIVFGSGSNFNERLATAKVDVVHHFFPPGGGTWAPRFGFAWDPNGRGKTSIRGGYGIAYDRLFMTPLLDFRNDPPLRATATLGPLYGTSFTYALGDPTKPYLGFPIDPALQLGIDSRNGIKGARVSVLAIDPNMKQAYTHNWFFGIQHELPGKIVAEVNYTGTAGHHLYEQANVNRFLGDLLTDGTFHGFNPSFSAVHFISSGSNSIYNAGSLTLKRSYQNGFSIQGSYTFSRAIDDADSLTNEVNYQDISNRRLDRALAGFDVTHRLSAAGIYELPFLRGSRSLAGHVLGGWQLSGFAVFQSGFPMTVSNSAYPAGDYNADGTAGDRPNAPAADVPRSGWTRQEFLNGIFPVSAFPIPVKGTNGTLGRNTFRGPQFLEVDMSLAKRFAITERIHMQLRGDAFNALNHVNLNSPVLDLSSATFGQSTSALSPRQFQVGARIEF
jgi:hypothetical protein